MNSYAEAFVESREAVCALAASVPAIEWERPSPLTPAWNVREVLCHLVGVSTDVAALNFPKGDMNEWTRRQVDAGAGLSLEQLVDRWRRNATEQVIDESFGLLIYDQITHEYDIRYALGCPGPASSEAINIATDFVLHSLLGSRDLSFHLQFDAHEYRSGDGTQLVELETNRFELLRLRAGRRSWDEIAELQWRGDLDAVRDSFFGNGFFTPATFRVNEKTV